MLIWGWAQIAPILIALEEETEDYFKGRRTRYQLDGVENPIEVFPKTGWARDEDGKAGSFKSS